MSLQLVGSRIELERYLDGLRYAQGASLERLAQVSEDAQVEQRCAELGSAQRKLLASQPAASAARLLLESASTAGTDVRTKIEDAHAVYERARAAREMVDQVVALRAGVQGIHGAMEVRDWERAASLAHSALQVPKSVAESEFAKKMVPSAELPEDPSETLRKACDDMAALFLREFGAAARSRKVDQLTRYFKLFPLIGRSKTGLEAYAQFICQIIAGIARNLLISAAESTRQNPAFYGAALSKLFENVAVLLEQHGRLVTRHYGPDAMAQVLPHVQQEIDKQAVLIIDTFWDERRVEQLLNRCRAYSYPVLVNSFTSGIEGSGAGSGDADGDSNTDTENDTDLRDASARLSELSTMLNRYHLYTVFAETRFSITPESTIPEKIDDLLGPTFATLALFVFRRSVERAIQLDELPTQQAVNARPEFSMEAPLASSLVDDVSYVFSSVLQQSVATGHAHTTETALAGLRRVLESDLVGTLQRKLRSTAPVPTNSAGEFGGAGPFMLYLNDLELLAYYIGEAVKKHSPPPSATTDSIESLRVSFNHKSDELVADGCQTLATVRLLAQARQAVSVFKNGSREFENQWKQMMRPLRKLLHPRVLSQVLFIVCKATAQGLEQYVWSLDGNSTVASIMELEGDISVAISCCVETQYALRQCFTRLAQIVTALVEGETSGLDADDAARVARFRMQ